MSNEAEKIDYQSFPNPKPAPKVKGPRKRLRSRSHRKVASRSPLKPQRLVDPAAIEAAKKPYCERCGAPAFGEPHHVVSQGSGGPDQKLNLIQLCTCHDKAHRGLISKDELFSIIAKRERMTPEEVKDAVYAMKV
jgi:hypothetical protein